MRVVDAVVVGGGILGAATAYFMSRAGLNIVLLERGSPNREGSGTTAGNLHIQAIHTRRPGQLIPVNNRRFLPLQLASSALWGHLEEELDASVELRRNGGLTVAETREQVEELHAKHLMEAEFGLRTEFLNGDQARAILPGLADTIAAAVWCDKDGYANPLKVTPAFLNAAMRLGAQVQGFSEVVAIERTGHDWEVRTVSETWLTSTVVDVAGPWIASVARLAGVQLAMAPVAIQMHATTRMSPVMSHLVQHVSDGLSVKQVSAGNILIGGGWPSSQNLVGGRYAVSLDSARKNLALASRILPFLRNVHVLRMWAGPLAATPDEMPVIGGLTDYPGLLVAGGTYAFTFAPLWGLILSQLATSQIPDTDLAGLSPDRLVESPTDISARRR